MGTALASANFSSSVTPTNNPQVANYSLTAPAGSTVAIQFGLTTQYGTWTSAVPAPPGGGQVSILVAGMLAGSSYHLRAAVTQNGTISYDQDHIFPTGPLPPGILPTLAVTGQNPSSGVELINIIEPAYVSVVADLQGNIIWYYNNAADRSWKGYAFPIKPLPNGNMLASVTNMYTQPYNAGAPQSALREIDLAGDTVTGANGPRELDLATLTKLLTTVPTPKGSIVTPYCYSHDVLPLPNEHVILLVQEQKVVDVKVGKTVQKLPVMGDALVDLDENYQPAWVWSAFDYLDVNRHPYEFDPAKKIFDWTHCNCVVMCPDGNLLLSSRNQSWVMKLNYAAGQGDGSILWTLGYQGSFTLSQGDTWFAAQHFPNILAVANNQITRLAVFDNGNDRVGGGTTKYSRAVVYSLNESVQTAAVAWQYLPNFYSLWGGDVVQLANGDMEVDISQPWPLNQSPKKQPPSQAIEVTPGANPQVAWQMIINPGPAYRSYRIPSLYPRVVW